MSRNSWELDLSCVENNYLDDVSVEHIADLVKNGYTSGQVLINGEERGFQETFIVYGL